MTPSEYYSKYIASDDTSPLSDEIIRLVLAEKPMHVFEFGCGTGKNLRLLGDKVVTAGLDISFMNVTIAHVRNKLPFVMRGTQNHLGHLCKFDVVFTVSVLDHIEDVGKIVNHFKRIAGKAVFIAETQDLINEYYFAHDYASMGFTRCEFKWTSPGNGAKYEIWKYEKVLGS